VVHKHGRPVVIGQFQRGCIVEKDSFHRSVVD
jgi:hypothetical protein